MGYTDPTPWLDRIADATSRLRGLTHDDDGQHPGNLLSDETYEWFIDALGKQADEFDHLVEQIEAHSRVARLARAGGRPDVPETDLVDRWFVVADMPVWRVWVRVPGKHNEYRFAVDDAAPAPAEAEIVLYLEEYAEQQLESVQRAAIQLAGELGYADFVLTDEQIGSIFRRFRGKLKTGLSSDYVQQKLQELDQRTSIEIIGRSRAEADAIKTSSAVSLIASLADIPNAVVRVGAILVIKQTINGTPAAVIRELSTREIRALELNPGIQREPQSVLQLLAAAVAHLEEDAGKGDTPPAINS